MRRHLLLPFLLAASALLAAPAQQPAAPAHIAFLDRAWSRGETIEFTLSWLRMRGGTATMTIQPGDPGTLRIHSLAVSNSFISRFFPVRDEIESIIDRGDFATVRYEKKLREGKRSKEELTVVDLAKGVATRKGKEIAVPRPAYDPLSVIFYLRRLDLSPGRRHDFTILADGKVYTVQTDVLRREAVKTEAGTFACVVVEPKMKEGGIFRDENNRLTVWYTDDERRIPVRIVSEIQAGTITASLHGYSVRSAAAQ